MESIRNKTTKRTHRTYNIQYIQDKYNVSELEVLDLCKAELQVEKHYNRDASDNSIAITQVGLMRIGKLLKSKQPKEEKKNDKPRVRRKAKTKKTQTETKAKKQVDKPEIVTGTMCRKYPNPRVIGCAVKGKDKIVRVTNIKAVVNQNFYKGRILKLEMTGEDTAIISGIPNGRR